jgi:hypothetical protein
MIPKPPRQQRSWVVKKPDWLKLTRPPKLSLKARELSKDELKLVQTNEFIQSINLEDLEPRAKGMLIGIRSGVNMVRNYLVHGILDGILGGKEYREVIESLRGGIKTFKEQVRLLAPSHPEMGVVIKEKDLECSARGYKKYVDRLVLKMKMRREAILKERREIEMIRARVGTGGKTKDGVEAVAKIEAEVKKMEEKMERMEKKMEYIRNLMTIHGIDVELAASSRGRGKKPIREGEPRHIPRPFALIL